MEFKFNFCALPVGFEGFELTIVKKIDPAIF